MIIDIPKSKEFMEAGLALLNFAWDTAAMLLIDLDEAEYYGVDLKEVGDAFWQASKQRLSTSLALVQQGTEFILKAKIAEISPFLLIMRDPRDWPKSCHAKDLSFAEFRTIDAQDLVKVHNTFAKRRLSDSFMNQFEDLRRKRNAIMHTVDKRIDIHVTDVICEILAIHHNFFPDQNWVRIRREFLNKGPISELHSTDYVEPAIIREFSLVTDLLKPADMKQFFGFNKRQRRYICPHCQQESGDYELMPLTATLLPNTPKSKNLYCFVCENNMEVERTHCRKTDCPGNVISVEYKKCVTCDESFG